MFLIYKNLGQHLQPQHDKRGNEVAKSTGREETVVLADNDKADIGNEVFEEESNKISDSGDPNEEEVKNVVNTNIISASGNQRKESVALEKPVQYTLEHKTVSLGEFLGEIMFMTI